MLAVLRVVVTGPPIPGVSPECWPALQMALSTGAPIRAATQPWALSEAGLCLFLVTGANKAERLAQVIAQMENKQHELPAAMVQPDGEPMFIVDEAAAAALPG